MLQTDYVENNARFSPDGRWIAYESNETGRLEIHIRPFPGPGRETQVSTNGGTNAQWRRDGREIFYLSPDNRLMAVPIRLPVSGAMIEIGTPIALFSAPPGSQYTASPDGQRFLINTPTEDASTLPITVILNWKPKS